ncbi:M16 family metallopeptidase [Aliarcobacter cryaerophilus]|uniref:M16 family metallopeptidase n=1 Tax=Aliarcobacter cryaerophilus TaxID=28198 RepID=UPI0021B2EADC|nr:pitrilysin family protein [Aliarcobacter cryaerophilus]MCT7492635.1 insulinase family protein [Aliarcobacter cryaerophilus]MCT7500029.1 insulinase family protein [Aliarcobacter cryaerophilus]MCT7505720.1 insulinase family protein [Aliarcobacter cryaerophilus]MCT7543925.1 insulinase family protein [Aliarcobacter cryaerophilus]
MSANSLPNYYTKNLDNGLQIVAIPMDNNTNVVSVDVFYKVGSRNEVMGKSGIAHMLEHLNFKSTKNLKAGEFDEIVKGFGGVNNAGTSFDYTHYYIKTSSKNTDKSLELFSELMQNLTLNDEEFQPERDVVAEERRWRTDNNPMGYLQFRVFNNTFIYHPYHWTPIGFMDDIKNWTIEDIKDFHSTYYQPQNAIVVVAGDIKKDDVFSYVEKHFKDIKNTKEMPSSVHTVEPKQDGERRAIINKESNVQMLAMTYHIPNFEHEDQIALSALSQLLSSGKSSILQKVLVDEKRLANSVYAYNMELKDPGVFMFMAVANENVDALKIEKEILDIISKIQKGEIKEKELDKLKINTKADFIYSLESSSDVASLFGTYLVRDNIKPLLEYEANLEKLKVEDIVNVAKKYLVKENSTTLILKENKQ